MLITGKIWHLSSKLHWFEVFGSVLYQWLETFCINYFLLLFFLPVGGSDKLDILFIVAVPWKLAALWYCASSNIEIGFPTRIETEFVCLCRTVRWQHYCWTASTYPIILVAFVPIFCLLYRATTFAKAQPCCSVGSSNWYLLISLVLIRWTTWWKFKELEYLTTSLLFKSWALKAASKLVWFRKIVFKWINPLVVQNDVIVLFDLWSDTEENATGSASHQVAWQCA
jgi:hypothetical protein